MNINYLRYYKFLYEEKNITKAAERLYISRQALSKAIVSMEEELGTKLITGSHSGVSFTSAGDYFYKRVLIILSEYERTLFEINMLNENGCMSIRLGVDYMTTYIYDDASLKKFIQDHPSIHIERFIATPDDLEKAYIENQYDIVLSHIRVPSTTSIQKISHIPFGFLVFSSDTLANKSYITLDDLKDRYVCATGGNLLFIQECNQFFKTTGTSIVVHATATNELFTNLKFIEENNAIFITTGYYLNSISGSNLYKFIPFNYNGLKKLPNHDVFMYCEENYSAQKDIKELREYLRKLPTKIKF